MQFIKRLDKKLSKLSSRKHKNSKIVFYLKGMAQILTPVIYLRRQLPRLLDSISCYDQDHILDRVAYYNKKQTQFTLGPDRSQSADLTTKKNFVYYLDFKKYCRFFDPAFSFYYKFGDVVTVPTNPTFVKSRPLTDNNENGILLKLNSIRHYTFVKDTLPYQDKKNKLVWRGKAGVQERKDFIRQYFNNPLFDVGQSNQPEAGGDSRRQKRFMPIEKQLQFKFILSIEGNDVATNLKWIMSSNSLCFMRKPRFETWFMEGRLLPDFHYVLLRDDYSDIEKKMTYYLQHEEEALAILRNARAYTKQFQNTKRENLISLMVFRQYFEQSGQLR